MRKIQIINGKKVWANVPIPKDEVEAAKKTPKKKGAVIKNKGE